VSWSEGWQTLADRRPAWSGPVAGRRTHGRRPSPRSRSATWHQI